jgi:UDP-N-acetyl-2-amino-2-deoxyglucuronate dehydrogenase
MFKDVRFFTEFERFDRHIEKLRRRPDDERVHYLTICSPNYLHDAHARFALRVGADVVCEKPVVLNPWNIDALQELEEDSGKRIYIVLQLRVHPALIALRDKIQHTPMTHKKDIVLTYITSRGPWYLVSWKGDAERSGGLATNIGVHFFDLLIWLFGKAERSEVHLAEATRTAGFLELKNANVRWYLSVDNRDVPESAKAKGIATHRSLTMDGEEIEFSEGFTDLHTVIYKEVLAGRGFGLNEARPSIELVHDIREAPIVRPGDSVHPLLKKG